MKRTNLRKLTPDMERLVAENPEQKAQMAKRLKDEKPEALALLKTIADTFGPIEKVLIQYDKATV